MPTVSPKPQGASPEDRQEAQYVEPYHYLPEVSEAGFRQHRFWSWGYRYLGRLKVVVELLEGIAFESLLDVGCGDGRFLKELHAVFRNKTLCGIDRSERAISLARSSNPGADYRCIDIRDLPMAEPWDVVTLLEVLEHIPPAELPEFMSEVAGRIKPGGALIVTVPHINQERPEKHYQHFDEGGLTALLSGNFVIDRTILFDNINWRMRLFLKFMGGSGKHFVITNQKLNNLLYNYYLRHCITGGSPTRCERIAVLAYRR